VHVIYNGIDTEEYSPDPRTDVLERHGVDPGRPSVVFVGRITRQKGVEHLLEAAGSFDPAAQLVLCAGAPDTPELGAEVARRVDGLKAQRDGVIWIDEMLPKPDIIQLLSHATVSACPSIYEPLGIVNLEAMACEAAVVATATGGIVEVVVDGETGLLVPFEPSDDGVRTPVDPRDSPQLSRSASMRWCGIPSGRRRWARPGGSACSSISRGRRSPSRLRRSTGKSPESPSRSAMRLSASVPGPATARPAAAA
jgi:glycosyltransferase involved in cell wall biosynthesis